MSDDKQIVSESEEHEDTLAIDSSLIQTKTQNGSWSTNKRAQKRKWILFTVIFVVGIILDQATKYWIWFNIPYTKGLGSDSIDVIPGFFELVHTRNPGAAFGIMAGQMYIFAIFTTVALAWIFVTIRTMHPEDKLQNVSLSLIASGAVGNGIDRMIHQEVIDFLRVYTTHGCTAENKGLITLASGDVRVILKNCEGTTGWLYNTFGTAEWPSFNVADAAIVVGLGLYIVHGLFFDKDDDPEEGSIPAPKTSPQNDV